MKKLSMTFGPFGGQHVPEVLLPALGELEEAFLASREDLSFAEEMTHLLRDYVGRPSPLYFAPRITESLGGAKVYLKREDLQPVFSFKLRGAYAKLVAMGESGRGRGVIAASAGNHAQGVALAASRLGTRAVIVMPVTTPSIKVAAVRSRGGEVVLHGDTFDEARRH
ncbi:MAG TPA: pyridoxal-phosphate dependent enzyme, partial [Aminobacteriaceae bacterium]|nr:pyridoxal-phosphate dependent enzyme [Aminobacteriaceae bacterium]